MKKQTLIHLNGLLTEVEKDLDFVDVTEETVGPVAIHKSKTEQKKAVLKRATNLGERIEEERTLEEFEWVTSPESK